jgi:hypothetical protein
MSEEQGKSWEGGNLHIVQPKERWRMQVLRTPYMCPFLGENGALFEMPRHIFLTFNPAHLVDGQLPDGCCYMDVEIVETTDQVIKLKIICEDANDYKLVEVLNSDRIVRFYQV